MLDESVAQNVVEVVGEQISMLESAVAAADRVVETLTDAAMELEDIGSTLNEVEMGLNDVGDELPEEYADQISSLCSLIEEANEGPFYSIDIEQQGYNVEDVIQAIRTLQDRLGYFSDAVEADGEEGAG